MPVRRRLVQTAAVLQDFGSIVFGVGAGRGGPVPRPDSLHCPLVKSRRFALRFHRIQARSRQQPRTGTPDTPGPPLRNHPL